MAPFAMMKGRYGYRMGSPMGEEQVVSTMVNETYVGCYRLQHAHGHDQENICTNKTYQKKYGSTPSPVRSWMPSPIVLRKAARAIATVLSRMRSSPLS